MSTESKKSLNKRFSEYLEAASKEVNNWPSWKKEQLGTQVSKSKQKNK